MPRGVTCKDECTSNPNLSRERLKQNTSNFAEIFAAMIKNFYAFAKNFVALHKVMSARGKNRLILYVHSKRGQERQSKSEN